MLLFLYHMLCTVIINSFAMHMRLVLKAFQCMLCKILAPAYLVVAHVLMNCCSVLCQVSVLGQSSGQQNLNFAVADYQARLSVDVSNQLCRLIMKVMVLAWESWCKGNPLVMGDFQWLNWVLLVHFCFLTLCRNASYEYMRILCHLLFLIIQYVDYAKHVAEGKYIDKNTHLKQSKTCRAKFCGDR